MSKVYADIIVDISQEKLDKSFQYEIPRICKIRWKSEKKCWFPLETETEK